MARNIWPGPSEECVSIAPADAAIAGGPIRSLYVGGTGDVVIQDMTGANITFKAVPVGTLLPVVCQQVRAATTATFLVGLR